MLMPAAKYFLSAFLITAILCGGLQSVQAQTVEARIDASITGVIPAVFEFDDDGQVIGVLEEQMVYRVFLPSNYDPEAEYPLILFLHGSGQSGSDNIDQIGTVLNTMILETDINRPAILLAPQLAEATGWSPFNPMDRTDEILELLFDNYSIDTDRLYLTGLSMGGFGATEYMSYYHQYFPGEYRFAAAAITAGAFVSEFTADTLSETPIWFSHGARDTTVDPELSLNGFNRVVGRPDDTPFMPISGLTLAGAPTDAQGIHRLSIYSTRGHGTWGPYYSSQDVYDWLFAQSLPEPLVDDLVANAAGDYVAAAGGPTNRLTTPPTGWSYWGSDAANGGAEVPLTAGQVGNQSAAYQGFNGVSSSNTAALYGTNTANSADFEIFGSGDANNAVVGSDLLLYPGHRAADSYVIVRYTVSDPTGGLVPGTGEVTGSFRELIVPDALNSVNGGSVDVFVYHNNTQLFLVDQAQSTTSGSSLLQADGTFNLTGLTLADGDTIDFVLFNNGNFSTDETALQANIFAEVLGTVLIGDVDLSGVVDFLDVQSFIAVLSAGGFQAEADCNTDGAVDFRDIAPFIGALNGF